MTDINEDFITININKKRTPKNILKFNLQILY